MTYKEATEFLFSQLPMFQRIGAAAYKPNLDTTIALCRYLGDPQEKFPAVHIAGTNGKGSVSHLLASIFQAKGLKTGLYTSPHLRDFRERIRVNGQMIPEEEVRKFVLEKMDIFQRLRPSFFEMTFGLAMHYFAECKIDIAVVETGMGGRLDSTNISRSILSIITNIGLDHTAFLGDTKELIAVEKAGIIKKGVPLVVGQTQSGISAIFRAQAKNLGATISFADRNIGIHHIDNHFPGEQCIGFDAKLPGGKIISGIRCPLTGRYQLKNFKTVLQATRIMNTLGYNIGGKAIREGFEYVLKRTGLLGRWTVLGHKPLIVCDTGHNADGIKEVTRQFRTIHFKQLHFVLGTVDDKDISAILSYLPVRAKYYFCKADIPRGLDAEILEAKARFAGLTGTVFPSVKAAYEAAKKHARKDDFIFIGGSTFVVAEIL